jgi:hypothetical protein
VNVPAVLAGLYPPAIRRRWGAEIAGEVRSAGPRTWFDTAWGAVKLWLHPSDWPETAPGQTSRVLLTALAAMFTTSVLLVRAFGPVPESGPIGALWLAPIAAGALLSLPQPVLSRDAVRRMFGASRPVLLRSALAVGALFVLAHSGFADQASGAVRVLLVAYYWATLGFVGLQLCVLVNRLGFAVVAPGLRRLRLALLCGGSGLALLAAQAGVESPALACGLAVPAAVILGVGRDLGRIPADM